MPCKHCVPCCENTTMVVDGKPWCLRHMKWHTFWLVMKILRDLAIIAAVLYVAVVIL